MIIMMRMGTMLDICLCVSLLAAGLAAVVIASDVAICAVMKNEHLDICEWIEYHRQLGVSRFYLYDNNSTTSQTVDAIFPYLSDGSVEYVFVRNDYAEYARRRSNPQLDSYQRCLDDNRKNHQFLAFLDIDEYIVIANRTETIPEVLSRYDSFGGLVLNWVFFSSSGHVSRPGDGVVRNYWKCKRNYHIKTIVNTKFATRVDWNPHSFLYAPGFDAVDSSYRVVRGPYNPKRGVMPNDSMYDVIYINHYVVKSLEDFQRKYARGAPDGKAKPQSFFDQIESVCTEDCWELIKRLNETF